MVRECMWCGCVCDVGVYVMWVCMWCECVCDVGVYVVWECA